MSDCLKMYHSTAVKGLITDHKENRVLENFSVPVEYVVPNQERELRSELIFPLMAYSAEEGTLIRVYFFQDEWRISTSSRIDAYESFWASRQSFGSQFEEYVVSITGTPLEVFLCSLDPSLKYFFLLPTSGLNRLGKLPSDESTRIFLVGIQTADGVLKYGEEIHNQERNAWSYLDEYVFSNFEDFMLHVLRKGNLIIYRSSDILKCISEAYKLRCDVRNNEMNVTLRYVELLRESPEQCKILEEMYPDEMYPELKLRDIPSKLEGITRYIHDNYMSRYVQKEYVQIPKTYYEIMKRCHEDYRSTREKTTLDKVWNTVLSQEPKNILSLIRNFP